MTLLKKLKIIIYIEVFLIALIIIGAVVLDMRTQVACNNLAIAEQSLDIELQRDTPDTESIRRDIANYKSKCHDGFKFK